MAENSPDGLQQDYVNESEEMMLTLPSAHSLRALVGTVPGVVWEAWGQPDAATQRIDYVSDYVEKMMGYSVHDWLTTPNFWLKLVHPEDRERAVAETTAVFASGGSGVVSFRWITKAGQTLWVNAHSTVIKSEDGTPLGMRGVTLDVTPQKMTEIALRENQDRITTLFRRLRESILQTQDRIGNNLQFIASLLEEHILEHTDAVPISELRQVRLRLMMLAEVQTIVTKAFREHDDIDHIPVRDILEVVPDMFTLEARFRPLHIEAEDIALTAARVNSLAIIASELISNAYRYGEGTVFVDLRRVEGQVVFTVRDEGKGFPVNFKPHDSINTGLNFVRSMAWSGLSGKVTFDNAPEGGARIVTSFPPDK